MIEEEGSIPKISYLRATVFTVISTWSDIGATPNLRDVKP